MVMSKSGSTIHPCIKEVIFVTSNAPPLLPQPRISSRIAELPSLRYGPIGARTTMTGPLRLIPSTRYLPKPREKRSCSLDRDKTPIKPPRRVRFALPPTDGARENSHGENSGAFPPSPQQQQCISTTVRNVNRENEAASQRPVVKRTIPEAGKFSLARRFEQFRKERLQNRRQDCGERVEVPVSVSPGVGHRVHPTGRYIRGTLSPTSNQAPHEPPASPGGQALLKAARDGEDQELREQLNRALAVGINEEDLNATDSSGRTILSYIASNGTIDLLDLILQVPGLDPNKPDNEGNTPLHFAAQAGQVECLNCLASRCRGVQIDARNNLGFTPLMKAALQGRNKCAKLLLFAGANPTLRDNGRGFRADQWARFCGRYVCADVIEKHARQRLLERSTSYGNWGLEHEMGNRAVVGGKVVPVPPVSSPPSNGLKSKLKKVFRTSSGPSSDTFSSARLVTQLTSAALCASSPVLPSSGSVPPMVKSLLRPLTVPRLQITLVNNNGDYPNNNLELVETEKNEQMDKVEAESNGAVANGRELIKPMKSKKKK